MTKKIIASALTALMLVTAGCSATPTPEDATPSPTPEEKAFYASELIKNAELWNGRILNVKEKKPKEKKIGQINLQKN